MKFQHVIDKVPNYKVFLTVDEMDESTRKLAEEFPDAVTVFEAGKSRDGHPIQCIKIGDGPKNALCFACPHPNEPIGAMTMEYLSRALAEDKALRDELGFTWYIIKCADPDGTRLNENWFKGPYNIFNYIRNYYRPVGYEQVEWTFPFEYKEYRFDKPLPETQVLMKIIDETRPEFMYSLHNGGLCGAYWYISHNFPELYEGFHNSARKEDVPLDLGEPETPFATEFAPAIFSLNGQDEYFDYMEKHTGKPPTLDVGADSHTYASSKADCVTLITELPYFFDPRIEDQSDSDISRREALLTEADQSEAFFEMLEGLVGGIRSYISQDNPFFKLMDPSSPARKERNEAQRKRALSDPEFEKPAKGAQVFSSFVVSKFYRGLSLGLAVRTCEFELQRLATEDSNDQEAITKLTGVLQEALHQLRQYTDELERELNYTVIPIQKLVRIQLESGLLVSNHISKNQ